MLTAGCHPCPPAMPQPGAAGLKSHKGRAWARTCHSPRVRPGARGFAGKTPGYFGALDGAQGWCWADPTAGDTPLILSASCHKTAEVSLAAGRAHADSGAANGMLPSPATPLLPAQSPGARRALLPAEGSGGDPTAAVPNARNTRLSVPWKPKAAPGPGRTLRVTLLAPALAGRGEKNKRATCFASPGCPHHNLPSYPAVGWGRLWGDVELTTASPRPWCSASVTPRATCFYPKTKFALERKNLRAQYFPCLLPRSIPASPKRGERHREMRTAPIIWGLGMGRGGSQALCVHEASRT